MIIEQGLPDRPKAMSDADHAAVKNALLALRSERITYYYCAEDDTFIWHQGQRAPFRRDDGGSHLRALVAARSNERIADLAVAYYKKSCWNSHITADAKARKLSPRPKSLLALLFFATVALLVFAQLARPQSPPDSARVTYVVEGTAKKAALTYINATGAVEQVTVPLPWRLEFQAPPERVFSIWAQSKNRGRTINSRLLCDGSIKQEAKSAGNYAVAFAKSACK